ncbi:MAG: molybdopterin-dependent oxidoreductase, partial [Candidatus Aminicenantaceae bacterium]
MNIIIDGKKIEAKEKKTILEIAKENNINIPSLCHHKSLIPFSGCRLCLVSVKGKKGLLPSCSTYIEDGMEIKTNTPTINKIRRQILSLILSEHPNACLICDEKENCDEYKSTIRKAREVIGCVFCPNNGTCELQEVVESLNLKKVEFPSIYRGYEIENNDLFIERNYNLCILCGKCVRICHEVRGASAISFTHRGSQTIVGTVFDKPLLESGCQFCGACVDVCPTGALVERAVKYRARPDNVVETICPLCGMGCQLELKLEGKKIYSSAPSEKGPVNLGQACVKGRFIIRDLDDESQRICKPLIRRKNKLEEVSWKEAIEFVSQKMKIYKGKETAMMVSSQMSCEGNYVFQKFAKEGLKTNQINSSVSISPFKVFRDLMREKSLPFDFNFDIRSISHMKTIVLLDDDIHISHPLIWIEIKKAVQKGARLLVISPGDSFINRFASSWLRIKPGSESLVFDYFSKIILSDDCIESFTEIEGFDSFLKSLENIDISRVSEATGIKEEELDRSLNILLNDGPKAILFRGDGILINALKDDLISLWNFSLLSQAKIYPLARENNSRGTLEIQSYFQTEEARIDEIFDSVLKRNIKALYLSGHFPVLNEKKPEFLLVQDSYINENMKYADVVLPSAIFSEEEGTYVNIEGRAQRFGKASDPLGDSKPGWWIISEIAKKMGNKEFTYKNPSQILKEIRKKITNFVEVSYP